MSVGLPAIWLQGVGAMIVRKQHGSASLQMDVLLVLMYTLISHVPSVNTRVVGPAVSAALMTVVEKGSSHAQPAGTQHIILK
jgi:hypothetical protein